MAKRALVLGGGGPIGIAWETGVILGLRDGGIDVRAADMVVGTSAGSMVGVRIAAGHDLADALEPPGSGLPLPEGGLDMGILGRVFQTWTSAELMSDPVAKEIGGYAADAPTCDEASWIATTGGACGVQDWPEKPYLAVGVDIDTGVYVAHDVASGAPLASAIAASCAIPGMFPPITIGGRRFMDGGVRSGTSADLVIEAGATHVLVIAPMCERLGDVGAIAERTLDVELEQIRAAGRRAWTIMPGEAEVELTGQNLMDVSRVGPAQEAGYKQAVALADGDLAGWLE